jgi:hypothetical protein
VTEYEELSAYAQFQIPGHQYSVVRFPLAEEWVPIAVTVAKVLAEQLEITFDSKPEPQPVPQTASASAPTRTAPPQPRTGQSNQYVVAYCPEHDNAPCQLSAPKYNPDGDKLYHPLNEEDQYKLDDGRLVKNHNLYWRQSVDANGDSNYGKLIPQPGQKQSHGGGTYEPQPEYATPANEPF